MWKKLYKQYVKYDKSYLRPNEVPALLGNSNKIQKTLNWKPEFSSLGTIIEHAWLWEEKLGFMKY